MAVLAGYPLIKNPYPDCRCSLLSQGRMSTADTVFLIPVFLVWLGTQSALMDALLA